MTGNRYYIYIYIIEYRIEYYVLIDWVVGLDGKYLAWGHDVRTERSILPYDQKVLKISKIVISTKLGRDRQEHAG